MIQDIAVNINAEFESCGKCGRRMEGDDAVYYHPTYKVLVDRYVKFSKRFRDTLNMNGRVFCNPECYEESLDTKVRDLLLAIDHNLELMRTYSNPHQDMPATPAQYIAEELETVRSYINNEI